MLINNRQEDLLAFHARTFGRSFSVRNTEYGSGGPCHAEDEEDEYLGYYPDGVKRTLTDQQIEIFRHSEIHSLRRQEELAREALSDGQVESIDAESTKELFKESPKAETQQSLMETAESAGVLEAEDDEEEYARFLEKERKEFADAAAKQREQKREGHQWGDRTRSTRRKVREMDAVAEAEVVLDY